MTENVDLVTGGRVLLDIINKSDDPEDLVNYLLCVVADLQRKDERSQSA